MSWLLVLIMLPASTSNGSAVNADKEQSLRDQESALIKLAELYRDQK
jgi:26S proteasome regulatory subunit N6